MKPIDMAINAVASALTREGGVVRGEYDGVSLHMMAKRAGDEIDDPDCHEVFQALRSGIYKRFDVTSGADRGYRWMHVCDTGKASVRQFLRHDFQGLSDVQLSSISVGVAFQNVVSSPPSGLRF